jgi:hypothetical protein
VSTRDYDVALVDRPALAPPLLVPGPPRRLVTRLHDWDDAASPLYTVHLFVLCEGDDGAWTLRHHHGRYRALTRAALAGAVAAAGFGPPTWHEAAQAGFHQPLLTAPRDA